MNADELKLNMQGTIYRFLRAGSEPAIAVGLNEGAVAAPKPAYTPNQRYNEKEYDFDGGKLWYTRRHGKIIVSHVKANAKDLYLPEEIEGRTVASVEKISGKAENIYYPYGVEEIDRAIGSVEGVKSLNFGYGDKPSAFKRLFGSLDNPETVEKIAFHKSIKDIY